MYCQVCPPNILYSPLYILIISGYYSFLLFVKHIEQKCSDILILVSSVIA